MSHFRQYFDSEYLGNWDLPRDQDVVVTIDKVGRGELTGQKGRKDKKAIIHFVGKKKPMAMNITNAKTVAAMYGNDVRQWVGKSIALYVTTTDSPAGQVDCIRIRPRIPQPKRANGAARPPASVEAPALPAAPHPEMPADIEDAEWIPEEPPPGALESDHDQS